LAPRLLLGAELLRAAAERALGADQLARLPGRDVEGVEVVRCTPRPRAQEQDLRAVRDELDLRRLAEGELARLAVGGEELEVRGVRVGAGGRGGVRRSRREVRAAAGGEDHHEAPAHDVKVASIPRRASPLAIEVSSSPPSSRSGPKRSAKIRRTAGTNDD